MVEADLAQPAHEVLAPGLPADAVRRLLVPHDSVPQQEREQLLLGSLERPRRVVVHAGEVARRLGLLVGDPDDGVVAHGVGDLAQYRLGVQLVAFPLPVARRARQRRYRYDVAIHAEPAQLPAQGVGCASGFVCAVRRPRQLGNPARHELRARAVDEGPRLHLPGLHDHGRARYRPRVDVHSYVGVILAHREAPFSLWLWRQVYQPLYANPRCRKGMVFGTVWIMRPGLPGISMNILSIRLLFASRMRCMVS